MKDDNDEKNTNNTKGIDDTKGERECKAIGAQGHPPKGEADGTDSDEVTEREFEAAYRFIRENDGAEYDGGMTIKEPDEDSAYACEIIDDGELDGMSRWQIGSEIAKADELNQSDRLRGLNKIAWGLDNYETEHMTNHNEDDE